MKNRFSANLFSASGVVPGSLKFGRFKSGVWLAVLFALVQTASAATFTVTNTGDSGGGSLRDAITQANNTPGADTIEFSLAAFSTITPLSPLPTITDTVNIGAGTRVELNGASAGDSGIGLRISAPNCVVQGMAINRFRDAGIRIDGGGNNTTIQGTSIGTNLAGDIALGNFNRGILIVGTTGNIIGGGGIPNVISGNAGTGISITAGGSATIRGNRIGTNAAGTADLGNTLQGIRIVDSSGSTIGGTTADQRNIISGNGSHGVAVIQSVSTTAAANNTIAGNYIGVNAGGNAQLSNSGSGVLLNAAGNTVGGESAAARNVISGNLASGVSISTNFANNNSVQSNFIGTGADGTTVIGNRDNGVQISNNAANNRIGGANAAPNSCSAVCNIIANNGDVNSTSARAGIFLDPTASVGNQIRGNSIFNNTGLGIDLGVIGVNANDAGDADTGVNNQQNAPQITAANSLNNTVTGTLNSTANTRFAIDVFISGLSDTQATSEARTFLGTTFATTNASGNAVFFFDSTTALGASQFVTATATTLEAAGTAPQAVGDTSELSSAQAVTASPAPAGREGDVSARPNGDGAFNSGDVTVIRSFVVGNATPDTTAANEFQRADSAPFETRGDGRLTAGDVTQTRRFVLGNDQRVSANGPTAPSGAPGEASDRISKHIEAADDSLQAPSNTYRVTPVRIRRSGNVLTVGIMLNTDASKTRVNSLSFTLTFDEPNALSAPTNCRPGAAAVSGGASSVACTTSNRPQGSVGVLVDLAPNETFNPGNQQIALIDFTLAPNPPATTTLGFSDAPTDRFISDVNGNRLDPADDSAFAPATISAPTAAAVTIGGRVLSSAGRGIRNVFVTLTDENGETRTALTGAFGNYRFTEVAAGAAYVVSVSGKRYTFKQDTVLLNVTGETGDVDFIASN